MLNRELLIVRLKQPFVDWINHADPNPDSAHVTLEDANKDTPVFLVHEYTCEDLDGWLKQCYLPLFEEVLEQWYLLPALWPQDRDLALFKAWCEVDVHGIVIDTVDGPLTDDDLD